MPNGGIVFIILQIFFATRPVLKIEEYPGYSPVQLGNIQSPAAFRRIARERKYLMAGNLD